jgi:hypothetical protein
MNARTSTSRRFLPSCAFSLHCPYQRGRWGVTIPNVWGWNKSSIGRSFLPRRTIVRGAMEKATGRLGSETAGVGQVFNLSFGRSRRVRSSSARPTIKRAKLVGLRRTRPHPSPKRLCLVSSRRDGSGVPACGSPRIAERIRGRHDRDVSPTPEGSDCLLPPPNRWWRCAYHRLMAENPPGSIRFAQQTLSCLVNRSCLRSWDFISPPYGPFRNFSDSL